MSSLTELESPPSHIETVLEIDGLDVVWHEHTRPTVANGHLAPMMDAHVGIIKGVTYRHSLDITGGIPSLGTYAVTLMDTGGPLCDGGVDNRASMLLRHGPDGADLVFTLAETLPGEAGWSGEIVVNEDVTTLPASGVVHVGIEAIAYTGIVAPNRLTIPVGGRGYLGTQARRHIADLAKSRAPRIYSDAVTWRGRGARLKLISWRENGTLAPDHVVLVEGVLMEAPTPQPDGTIALTIIPWLGRLDAELGETDALTRLQHGWHIGDDAGVRLDGEVSLFWPAGTAYDEATDGTAFVATNNLSRLRTRGHADVFDITQPSPRDGDVVVGVDPRPTTVTGYAGSADGGTLIVGNVYTAAAGDRIRVQSIPAAQRYTYQLSAPGLIHAFEWPGILESVSAAWQPGTNKGAGGLWADVAILAHDEGTGGPALSVRVNSDHHARPPILTLSVLDSGDLWYPLDLSDPSSEAYPQAVGERDRWGLWEPREVALQSRKSKPNSPRDIVRIRGIADAYHQGGETRLLVEQDIFTPPPFVARAEWKEGDDDRSIAMVVTAVSLADDLFPGVPGYVLTIDLESSAAPYSFADWPGQERATIREQVYWDRQTPANIILQLLTSVSGNADNGLWDVLPWGVGVPIQYIDTDSFLTFAGPVGVGSEWSRDVTHGTTAKEVLETILTFIRAAIVPRLDLSTGALKLAIVSIGAAVWTDAIASYDDDDWALGLSPWSDTDRSITNAIEVKTNYGRDDKPQAETTIIDSDSVGEHGGELSTMTMEARGIRLSLGSQTDRVAALLPMADSLLRDLSYERLIVHLTVPWSRAIRVHVGAVIMVTSTDPPTLRDYRGQLGAVREQAMMVTRIDCDPMAHTASIDALWVPGRHTGWAPSLRVVEIVDAVTLRVAVNAYTSAAHPATGLAQTDLDYYADGDVVTVIPDGDYSARVSGLTITIAGTMLTLSGAHGLITTDASIDPDPYATQSDSHRMYASLADTSGLIVPSVSAYLYL